MPPTEIGKYISTLKALGVRLVVDQAERGQRRVEGPPFGLDQFGLDPYINPELFELILALMQKAIGRRSIRLSE
jgi:hypothetical protein